MRFVKFLIGGLLIFGSIAMLVLMFTFGLAFAGMWGGHSLLGWLIGVIIVLVAFLGGVWLVRKNRP